MPGQTPTFTYQGRLQDGGTPANGTYDLQFRLFDASSGGNQVGTTLVREDVLVSGGMFSVSLGFGAAAFPGADRFLEIGVRPGTSTGAFTALSPLRPITATPYAVQSLNATNAVNAANATSATNATNATNARHLHKTASPLQNRSCRQSLPPPAYLVKRMFFMFVSTVNLHGDSDSRLRVLCAVKLEAWCRNALSVS